MAVRFDAATDRISIADTLPDPAMAITITGWAYVSADTGANATMCRVHAASGGSTSITFATDGAAPAGAGYFTGGGSITSSTQSPVGAWRKVAVTCTGTSGNLYVATVGGGTDNDAGTVAGAASPTGLTLGGRSPVDGSEWFNGRLAYWRVWSAALSQAEIEAEWASTTPVRAAGLWADWPLETHTDLTDHSGNGRDLSAGSTAVTTEAGPPLATDVTGAATGQGGGTGTATGTPEAPGTATGAGGGVGSANGTRERVGSVSGQGGGIGTAAGGREVTGAATGHGGGVGAATDTQPPAADGGSNMQIKAIMAKVTSVVQALGLFENSGRGPLTHTPGAGLRVSVWPGRITSPPGSSGLASVSLVLPVMIRIYGPVHPEPVDEIDDEMLEAVDRLGDAYVGGFTLGALVRGIDIHGRFGQPLTIEPGYLDVQAGTCRVQTMTLPLIINDAWNEVP